MTWTKKANTKYAKSKKGKIRGKRYRESQKGIMMKEKTNKKYYNKIKSIMKKLKINGCSICGYDGCNSSLVFHHVNKIDKKFELTKLGIITHSDEHIIEELNKCILLCCNHHGEIHEKEWKVM